MNETAFSPVDLPSRLGYQIVMENIEMAYPTGPNTRKVVINGGFHLRIKQGEFVTIVGPSGCGKSTVLNMVMGARFPTQGGVLLDGQPVTHVTRNCGMVYQKYNLFPHLRVLDNIALGPILEHTTLRQRIFHTPKYFRVRKQAREEAMELLLKLGLEEGDAKKYPFELSGGMRQRVAIGQALMMHPKVLLMDEPFGALDDSTRRSMQELILRQWKEHGTTILFVTHDLEEALYLGTRIIAISQYWTGKPGQDDEGAVIVTDKKLPAGDPEHPEVKYTKEFITLLQCIRRDALNPEHCQGMDQFDIDHPDGFHPVKGWLSKQEPVRVSA